MKLIHTRTYNALAQYLISIFTVLIVVLACYSSEAFLAYKAVALILLLTVSVLAMLFDILPVLLAAVLSALTWNFFFIPPIFTFHIDNAEDVLLFLSYFFVALINAVLSFKIRKEQQKSRNKEEKEQAIKLYNTLLNSLSHELRTPIATIIGAVDVLKMGKNLSAANSTELLSEIDTASIRLNRQVENLLNMSRLETGMLKPKLDWCDTNELIHALLQKHSEGLMHQILFEANESLPLLKYDRGLIEQCIQNLLLNAINYTPENTIIQVFASFEEGNCLIAIVDNGPGIPEAEQAAIFDKFYRIPSTKTGGSGLGLSIVKGFIEAHNGQVTVRNAAQGGANFTLSFPTESIYLNKLKHE